MLWLPRVSRVIWAMLFQVANLRSWCSWPKLLWSLKRFEDWIRNWVQLNLGLIYLKTFWDGKMDSVHFNVRYSDPDCKVYVMLKRLSLIYFGMKLKNVLKHICDWTSPDCWSDSKPEVRELLESIRQYRHHDDNIFTVQFSATNTTCSDD